MDCFSKNRAALMSHLSFALQSAEQQHNNDSAGMIDMFAQIAPKVTVKPLPECDPWDEKKRLIQEKEALGLFLTGHPLLIVQSEIKQISSTNLSQWLALLNTGETSVMRYRQKAQQTTVCGLVVDIRIKNGSYGREAFVTLDDRTGRVDVRVSPALLQEIEELVTKDLVWVVEGGIAYDDFNNGIKLKAERVQLLDDYRRQNARLLHIKLNGDTDQVIDKLIAELNQFQGQHAMPVAFHLHKDGYDYEMKTNGGWSVIPSEQCLLSIAKHLDQSAFYVEYP
ncbi:MAG: DNA polymerase-3 subunit alpha [Gammaproteobacteria bacterium]|jgi:DNA polymerase-3 subunit alpha